MSPIEAAGDLIPADMRIIECVDLFVSQSSLTGESEPVEKLANVKDEGLDNKNVADLDNIGPISFIFDIVTFWVMWFIFKANTPDKVSLFQSGWFVVGLQSLL